MASPRARAAAVSAVFGDLDRRGARRLADAIERLRWLPELRTIGDYHARTPISRHWRAASSAIGPRKGRAERLLLSFHGIPQRYVTAGDPYAAQCRETAARLAARLDHGTGSDMVIRFQSRVGREEWLRPYTDETLLELARRGWDRCRCCARASPSTAWRHSRKSPSRTAKRFLQAAAGVTSTSRP